MTLNVCTLKLEETYQAIVLRANDHKSKNSQCKAATSDILIFHETNLTCRKKTDFSTDRHNIHHKSMIYHCLTKTNAIQ